MGRFYFGDIEGKFWFGIQDSDDAKFFGVEPHKISYKKCGCYIEDEKCDCITVDHECNSECESECDIETEPNGVKENSNEVYFDFEKTHNEVVKNGIATCIREVGDKKQKLDEFFEKYSSYTIEMLIDFLNIPNDEIGTLLEWYARLLLGQKILECLESNDQCHFGCEL